MTHGINSRWVDDDAAKMVADLASRFEYLPDPVAYRTHVWVRLVDGTLARIDGTTAHALLAVFTRAGIDVAALATREVAV